MSDDANLYCPYCDKKCKTTRGVTQHINQTKDCREKQIATISASKRQPEDAELKGSSGTDSTPDHTSTRCSHRVRKKNRHVAREREGLRTGQGTDATVLDSSTGVDLNPTGGTNREPGSVLFREPNDDGFFDGDDTESENENDESEGTGHNSEGSGARHEPGSPNTTLLEQFRAYCDKHDQNFLPLRASEATSIKLLHVLKLKKAPLNAYKELLEWHLRETGTLAAHETLKDTTRFKGRDTLMNQLANRYNVMPLYPKVKRLRLPHSKAVVPIVYTNAADCIVSLLTDPRCRDTDYLFHNDDPLAPPPANLDYVSDLNTGDAYISTYRNLVTEANQNILPMPLYIDGAVTGQFSDLPITALKITLGIFTREARDREDTWRILGYVPQVRKEQGRGKKLFQESKHLESTDVMVMAGEGEEAEQDSDSSDTEDEGTAVKAQDFHTILDYLLKSYVVDLQDDGIIWDLVFKRRLWKHIHWLPFVPFIKCDTEEGDLLCGKFLSRTRKVKHLCRYCHCPTDEADDPRAKYPHKTQAEIQKLIEKGDLEGLKQISQQNIRNAFYKVRFHSANGRGIHGACPSEMLHAILLGLFKYLRDIFFHTMGKTSQLAEDINALAMMYGKLFTRQSDRMMPNTNFTKGIRKGKLMAKWYRGVLLIMAAVLRSEKGKALLMKRRKFGKETGLRDWMLLMELFLEWEAFLNEKRMLWKHVIHLRRKHCFIMYIMKTVAKREAGMGLKIMKFHAILHLVEDILLYGVPTEFDTGSNESHHKASKVAAKLTQRNEATFNQQTSKRLAEFLVIDLAMQEVANGRKVWEYFDDVEEWEPENQDEGNNMEDVESDAGMGKVEAKDHESEASDMEVTTGGTKIRVSDDPDEEGGATFELLGRSKHKGAAVWMDEVVLFLNNLQNVLWAVIPNYQLPICCQHV